MKDRIASFLRRNSQAIPLTVIVLCLGGILLMQATTIQDLKKLAERQSQTLERLEENDEASANREKRAERHLDCVVEFFSHEDRSEKAIANIQTCRISSQPSSVQPAPQPQPLPQQPNQQPRTPSQQSEKPKPQKPNKSNQPSQEQPITGIPLFDRVLKGLGI